MWPYWLIYIIPAWFSLKYPYQKNDHQNNQWNVLWAFYFIFLVMMIGYRYEVGGDWGSYYMHVVSSEGLRFYDLDFLNEPLFRILAWLGAIWGGIYLFNLFAGATFCYGLFRLCYHFNRPWLCLTLAIPYLLIVVAMGYSRQAGALGAFMLGLLYLEKGDIKKYLFCLIFGSFFHKTVIFMFVLGIIKKKKFSIFNTILITSVFFIFWILLEKYFFGYYRGYILAAEFAVDVDSSGPIIRGSLNILPAAIYLLLRKKFTMFSHSADRIYMIMSILSILAFLALFYSNFFTAIDRMALYFLPLQFIILGNLPDVLGENKKANRGWILNILILYAFVEYVWLFRSVHSQYWLPYKFYLWEMLW